MRREAPRALADYGPLVFPAAMLIVFFVAPFGTMLAVSFFKRQQGGFYTPGFVFDNYARFLSPFFGGVLTFSLFLSITVAVVAVAIATPFTYLLVRSSRRAQVAWLVALLAIISLSEVIIGFAWSTLLSRTAGITNILVALGLMSEPQALTPGFGAVLTGMVYQTMPYSVLVLYPAMVRLDPTLTEAARTLGASPVRAFFNIVLPTLTKYVARHRDHGLHFCPRQLSAAANSRPPAPLDAFRPHHRSGALPVQHAFRRRDGGVPGIDLAGAHRADAARRQQESARP